MCKQCQRNELLQIMPAESSARFFAADRPGRRLIAHRATDSGRLETANDSTEVIAAIGPEGGWADDEFHDSPRDTGENSKTWSTTPISIRASTLPW